MVDKLNEKKLKEYVNGYKCLIVHKDLFGNRGCMGEKSLHMPFNACTLLPPSMRGHGHDL